MKKIMLLIFLVLTFCLVSSNVHAITWLFENIGNAPGNVQAVVMGDPDNDDIMEIVTGDSARQITLFEKILDTWGQLAVISDAGAAIIDLCVGDADNDAQNEIVAVTGSDNPRVLVFNGSGNDWSLDEVDSIAAGYGATVEIGDADNDGENEVVVGTTGSDLYLYEGSYHNWTKFVLSSDLDGMILGLAIGDADNNGENEIVVGSYGEMLYEFHGSGSMWANTTIGSDVGWPIRDVAVGDADNDGENEIVVGAGHYSGYGYSSGGAAYLFKYIADVWYKFNMGGTGSDYYISRIGVYDLDDDGYKEVVSGWGAGFYYRYGRVKLGNGSLDNWTWTELSHTTCGTQDATRFYIGDLDGDFLMDMVFAETGRQYIRIIHDEDLPEIPIPEFPSVILLPLFMTAVLLAAVYYRRRSHTRTQAPALPPS